MKKLLAILLALMLLTASAAVAERAQLIQFNNIEITHSVNGRDETVRLEDLNAVVALGAPDGVATIQLDVDDGSQSLLGMVMQFKDDKALLGIEGMDRPLASAIDTASMDDSDEDPMETLAELFANLDKLPDGPLPVFTGETIPKVDLFDLAGSLSEFGFTLPVETDANGARTAAFTVPANAIQQALALLPLFIPEENKAQLQPALNQLSAQFKTDPFHLEGKLFDNGERAELLINVVPETDRGHALSDAGSLLFVSTENYDSLQLLVNQEGEAIPIATFELTSDPDAATLDLTIDVPDELYFGFGLRPSKEIAGAQVVAMTLTVEDETLDADVTYGTQGDTKFMNFTMNIPDEAFMSVHIDETPDGNGGKTGALEGRVEADGEAALITADITEQVGSYAFRAVENAEDAYDVEQLGSIESRLLEQQLNNALAPLIAYLNNLGA